jgi:hypothetical protein
MMKLIPGKLYTIRTRYTGTSYNGCVRENEFISTHFLSRSLVLASSMLNENDVFMYIGEADIQAVRSNMIYYLDPSEEWIKSAHLVLVKDTIGYIYEFQYSSTTSRRTYKKTLEFKRVC